ncbi:hypothetical protein ACJIZ3_020321 [Penstemon smallii]|uniref:Uncharacterized protein n=1 Tax=Penstemon smallii TaxID=265156 RepID=A0ABD3SII3_9LAMI
MRGWRGTTQKRWVRRSTVGPTWLRTVSLPAGEGGNMARLTYEFEYAEWKRPQRLTGCSRKLPCLCQHSPAPTDWRTDTRPGRFGSMIQQWSPLGHLYLEPAYIHKIFITNYLTLNKNVIFLIEINYTYA